VRGGGTARRTRGSWTTTCTRAQGGAGAMAREPAAGVEQRGAELQVHRVHVYLQQLARQAWAQRRGGKNVRLFHLFRKAIGIHHLFTSYFSLHNS
jgi:hypothetical protein